MTSTLVIPDQTDATAELYKSVIGPVNQSYYLRVFAHFDAKGKTGILWHWSAFFTTLNWFVFRKMWGMAAWYAGVSLVFTLAVFGIGKLAFAYSETTEEVLTGVSLLLVFVLPGLFANAAYYRFCERTINSVLVTGVGVPQACEILTQRASSGKRLLGLTTLNLLALAMLVTLVNWVPGAHPVAKLPSSTGHLPSESNTGAEPVQPSLAAPSAFVTASAPIPAPALAAPAASVPARVPVPVPASSLAVPTHGSSTVRPIAQQYFIQVGAFANLKNARKTMAQLEAMGLDAGAAPVVVSDGRLTRIRVGPFKTRAEAHKAADKIKAQGLPALFVKL